MSPPLNDHTDELLVLVPDADIEATLRSLLHQPERLGIPQISYVIYRHPQRDPGVRTEAHDFLRTFCTQFRCVLVVLDLEGSGWNNSSEELERDLEDRLSANGWPDGRAKTIAINPELEVWVWSRSASIARTLGWERGDLFGWLSDQGLWPANDLKPTNPKEAFDAAIKEVGLNRSPCNLRFSCSGRKFRRLP